MPILFRGELRLVHRRSLQPLGMFDLPRRQCTVLVKSSVSRFRSEFTSQCSHVTCVTLDKVLQLSDPETPQRGPLMAFTPSCCEE